MFGRIWMSFPMVAACEAGIIRSFSPQIARIGTLRFCISWLRTVRWRSPSSRKERVASKADLTPSRRLNRSRSSTNCRVTKSSLAKRRRARSFSSFRLFAATKPRKYSASISLPRATELMTVTDLIRSGNSKAVDRLIAPPNEWPTRWNSSSFSASANPRRTLANPLKVGSSIFLSELP
jgi:hypothetical protein